MLKNIYINQVISQLLHHLDQVNQTHLVMKHTININKNLKEIKKLLSIQKHRHVRFRRLIKNNLKEIQIKVAIQM